MPSGHFRSQNYSLCHANGGSIKTTSPPKPAPRTAHGDMQVPTADPAQRLSQDQARAGRAPRATPAFVVRLCVVKRRCGESIISWATLVGRLSRSGNFGGLTWNRTGCHGFAVRCVTTPPSGQVSTPSRGRDGYQNRCKPAITFAPLDCLLKGDRPISSQCRRGFFQNR